jgi:hypothetical protein
MCKATTKAGAPCRKPAVENGLCLFHSGRLDLAELGRRGGRARGKKQPQQTSDRLEGLALEAIEEMLVTGGNATARARAIGFVLDRVSVNSTFAVEAARRALYEEQQAELKAALPDMRAKLAELIDRRARELAEQMREERTRLELEAVKAELKLEGD